jgi:hypothetical protein
VTGPTGPTGGLSTIVVQTNFKAASLHTDDILSVIAACAANEVLLSGGFMVEPEMTRQSDLGQVVPIQSGPTVQPNEWQSQIIATADTGMVTLVVSVVCAVP